MDNISVTTYTYKELNAVTKDAIKNINDMFAMGPTVIDSEMEDGLKVMNKLKKLSSSFTETM